MLHATKPTVLLIETDISLRRLIALGLQYRGMKVLEATSPTNLPTLEAQSPDLLILDIDGRASSNWSLLTTMQTHPYFSTLPIIILAWECPECPIGAISEQQSSLPTQITCL